jgi:hypothetical protein
MKDKLKATLTLPLFLHTTNGVEATIRFLENTKIATRGWHTKRHEDEEEEDVSEEEN